ncbi:MAG: DUF4157 domain-containing protein [Clostridiales bacterium]|nr:DUF4157 domain-containing protein [Clostridiales bacterium]
MYKTAEKQRIQTGTKAAPAQRATGAPTTAIPNSVMASMAGSDGGGYATPDLGQQIQARLFGAGERPQAQIPQAENEADRLSASVRGGSPEGVKSMMGQRMGADFSGVRFHTGAEAAARADAMGARAYTSGADVYFGEGGFDPGIAAHELVHTVQQGVVDSGVSTMATPMGGVQMKPDDEKKGDGLLRYLKKGGTAATEFVGGKLSQKIGPSKGQKQIAMEKAQNGDYSSAASVGDENAEVLVAQQKALISHMIQAGKDLPGTNVREGATQALNPFYRKALSEISRDKSIPDDQRQKIKDAMESMDTEMMVNTMRTPTGAQRSKLRKHYRHRDDQWRLAAEYQRSNSGKTYLGSEGDGTLRGAEEFREQTFEDLASHTNRSSDDARKMARADLKRAKNSGDALLRTMFLMQLGDFKRKDTKKKWLKKSKNEIEWDQTMASAFSHGGRTGFLFGTTDEEADENGVRAGTDEVANAIFGAKMGKAAGVHTRAAGTHHINTPEKGGSVKDFKEGGGIRHGAIASSFDSKYQHYGMDMAIGGIGNAGGAGAGGEAQMINADGRSGHLYIGKRSSTDTEMGGLLMGLESDSPYRMNQTGHMHNAAAASEEGSSTGGLKKDIQGDKYGGRTVDLSMMKNSELVEVLGKFTDHVKRLRQGGEEGQAQYEQLLQQMAGQRMSGTEMETFLTTILGDADRAKEMAGRVKRRR